MGNGAGRWMNWVQSSWTERCPAPLEFSDTEILDWLSEYCDQAVYNRPTPQYRGGFTLYCDKSKPAAQPCAKPFASPRQNGRKRTSNPLAKTGQGLPVRSAFLLFAEPKPVSEWVPKLASPPPWYCFNRRLRVPVLLRPKLQTKSIDIFHWHENRRCPGWRPRDARSSG